MFDLRITFQRKQRLTRRNSGAFTHVNLTQAPMLLSHHKIRCRDQRCGRNSQARVIHLNRCNNTMHQPHQQPTDQHHAGNQAVALHALVPEVRPFQLQQRQRIKPSLELS